MTPSGASPVTRTTARSPGHVASTRATRQPAPTPVPGVLVAVTGASGGVGASVVAAALAVRAVAAGRASCVVDLDPLGGGLDVVLGLEQTVGTRWADLAGLDGEADGRAVLPTLPRADGVRVLSHDRQGAGVGPAVVGALVRALVGVCDLVVLDLPRPGRLPGQVPPLDGHLVLAGTGLTQVAALSAVLAQLPPPGGPHPDAGDDERGLAGARGSCGVLLRAGTVPGSGVQQVAVLMEQQLGVRVVGVLPEDRSVAADLAHGAVPGGRPGPLARALDPVLAEVLLHRRVGAA